MFICCKDMKKIVVPPRQHNRSTVFIYKYSVIKQALASLCMMFLLLYVLSAKDRLFNGLIDDLNDMEFPVSMHGEEMQRKIMIIVDVLWFIDGSHDKINSKIRADERIPERYVFG